MAGTLNYGGVLADYRRYFMPVRPFTFAVRGMHYGRYGADAEDSRLPPLFLGYQGLVRGYDFGSFDANECESLDMTTLRSVRSPERQPRRDRERGAALPAAGPVQPQVVLRRVPDRDGALRRCRHGVDSATKPRFAGGERDWVRSAGVALRVNVLGFAIAEIDYVRPLDRSRKGWLWQFGLTPGF